MSTDPQLTIPLWTVADRLRKARRNVGLTAKEVAQYLGVSERAVTAFETGDRPVRDAYLRSWCEVCRVPFHWLKYGALDPAEIPDADLTTEGLTRGNRSINRSSSLRMMTLVAA